MSKFLEIINPSDEAFIDAEDKEAACLAVAIFSNGRYSIEGMMPVFLFGGSDEWFKNEFNRKVDESFEFVGNKRVSDALRTVKMNGERTSMNDIVKRAHNFADHIDKQENIT